MKGLPRRVVVGVASVVAGVLTTGWLVVGAASAADGGAPLSAALTGAAERPGPGDPNGSGTATVRVNPGLEQVCVDLVVEDIAPATAAHIHKAPVAAPGPVVVPLSPPTDGASSDCYPVDRDLARDILRNPQDYYVNVHNAEFPAGAVRGQLSRQR